MSSQTTSTTHISSSSQETSTSEEPDLALFINMDMHSKKGSSSCLSPPQSQDDTQGWQEGSQSPTSSNNVPMMSMFDADLNADFKSFTSNCSVSMEESMEVSDDTHPLATISPKPISIPFGSVVPPSEVCFASNYQPNKRQRVSKRQTGEPPKRRGR